MQRPFSAAADELLGVKVPVLDHGYVMLVDYMGNDESIAQMARVSYGAKKGKTPQDDERLIRRLMRDRHTSPFEGVELKWELCLPIFVMRQLVRHRTASLNEVSRRYTPILVEEDYAPERFRLVAQSKVNKQGGGEELPVEVQDEIYQLLETAYLGAYEANRRLEELGLAHELARIVQPVGSYTKVIWKCDLHNIFHFLRLRDDPHAQYEIRVYAEVLSAHVAALCPVAHQAWVEYVKESLTLSRAELQFLLRTGRIPPSEEVFTKIRIELGLTEARAAELRALREEVSLF